MCGAIINARLPELYFGACDPKAGAVRSLYQVMDDTRLNHQVTVHERIWHVRPARCWKLSVIRKRKGG